MRLGGHIDMVVREVADNLGKVLGLATKPDNGRVYSHGVTVVNAGLESHSRLVNPISRGWFCCKAKNGSRRDCLTWQSMLISVRCAERDALADERRGLAQGEAGASRKFLLFRRLAGIAGHAGDAEADVAHVGLNLRDHLCDFCCR